MFDQDFDVIYNGLADALREAPVIEMGSWQSTTANPNALRMREVTEVLFKFKMPFDSDLLYLRENVKPFLPWADKHFEQERVSFQPINPGETYKEWRFPASASQHTDFEFSHSYAERYWPQYAGMGDGGHLSQELVREIKQGFVRPRRGIRHDYGDLLGVIDLLVADPTTRQAYLPIFYPEDITAARKKERVPCTLGYHFIMRNGKLNVFYPMRSCDLTRHLRDDVYLTCRLAFFVLDQVRQRSANGNWDKVIPGNLSMYISSLHCFESDEV